MEITLITNGDTTEVHAVGRLDGYWSDHLTQTLDELVRTGRHNVLLRMGRIEYMSSIGIRVLVSAYKNFRAVSGNFAVADPVENVAQVLRTAGLAALLMPARSEVAAAAPGTAGAEQFTWRELRVEAWALTGKGMRITAHGSPLHLRTGTFTAADCHPLPVTADTVSLGLGAFGADFAQCADRFGEYLALAGAAVCLPGDGSNTCDSLVATGDYTPEVQTLYGLGCRGDFARLLRFEPADASELPGGTPFATLAELALEQSGAEAACLVVVAESGGLIGASLRRSPARNDGAVDPLGFPAAREWLSMTSEPVHVRDSVIIAAVVARAGALPPDCGAQLRPLAADGGLTGHAHAAAYRFRALQRGHLELSQTIEPFVAHGQAETVLHLLGDDRDATDAPQSLLIRGACWIAPLSPAAGDAP